MVIVGVITSIFVESDKELVVSILPVPLSVEFEFELEFEPDPKSELVPEEVVEVVEIKVDSVLPVSDETAVDSVLLVVDEVAVLSTISLSVEFELGLEFEPETEPEEVLEVVEMEVDSVLLVVLKK